MNRHPHDTVGVAGTVYVLHFEPAYHHARHYIGWALDVDARLGVWVVVARPSSATEEVDRLGDDLVLRPLAIAGGRRTITLTAAHPDGQLVMERG